MALGKKTGGRKPGSKNKLPPAVVAAVQENKKDGITPLEVMLRTMRALWKEAVAIDEKTGVSIVNVDRAKDAVVVANSAARYCHASIAPKEEIPPAEPVTEETSLQDAGRRIAFALAAAEHELPKALPAPKKKVAA